MILYCCRTTYLDVLRLRLAHRNFQSDPPNLFIRQQCSSPYPYGDDSFAYRNKGKTIYFVRIAFCRQCLFILQNILRNQPCKCNVFGQFESKKYKYLIDLLEKNFFVIGLLLLSSVSFFARLFHNRITIYEIYLLHRMTLNTINPVKSFLVRVFLIPCFLRILMELSINSVKEYLSLRKETNVFLYVSNMPLFKLVVWQGRI